MNNKCETCAGKCCKSIDIEIPTPEDIDDFEDLKWYLYHPGLTVYIDEDGSWNVEVESKCRHLDDKGLCKVYSERPPVCRTYSPEQCSGIETQKTVFKTAADVDEYVRKLVIEGKIKEKTPEKGTVNP